METPGPGRAAAPPEATPAPAGVPWTRAQQRADAEAVARCVAGPGGDASEGTRWGDWCLLAGSSGSGETHGFTLTACAASPAAEMLTFVDGRELDFVLRREGRPVWSSATGRVFPATAPAVKASYGECTVWKLTWDRRGDDGSRLPAATYVLDVTLRLTNGEPADKHVVLLGD